MELINCFTRYGTVRQYLGNGIIKASVPGLFDDGALDKLPPIQFSPFGKGSFDIPEVGDPIIVIGDHTNPLLLYWVPRGDIGSTDPAAVAGDIQDEEGRKIVCSKELDGIHTASMYIDNNGCHVGDGDTLVTINDTDGVTIDADKVQVGSSQAIVTIGAGKHPAAAGEVVDDKITLLKTAILQLYAILTDVTNSLTVISGVPMNTGGSPMALLAATKIGNFANTLKELQGDMSSCSATTRLD